MAQTQPRKNHVNSAPVAPKGSPYLDGSGDLTEWGKKRIKYVGAKCVNVDQLITKLPPYVAELVDRQTLIALLAISHRPS